MKSIRILYLILILLIIVLLSCCRKEEPISLTHGQTMVEIIDKNHMIFKESRTVNQHSYKGKTFETYVKNYFHNSIDSLLYTTHIINLENGNELKDKEYKSYQNDFVVDFNKFDVKNAPIYIYVPGKVELLLTSDLNIDYELINDSFVKVLNLHNETSANIVYSSSDYKSLPKLNGNYVLFNYGNIKNKSYEEVISIDLEGNEGENAIKPLNQWVEAQGYNNYASILKDYTFFSVLTKEVVSSRLLKKYSKAYIITLGDIKNETYFRAPKEVVFISGGVNYSMIDDRTLLIKNGNAIVIYK